MRASYQAIQLSKRTIGDFFFLNAETIEEGGNETKEDATAAAAVTPFYAYAVTSLEAGLYARILRMRIYSTAGSAGSV